MLLEDCPTPIHLSLRARRGQFNILHINTQMFTVTSFRSHAKSRRKIPKLDEG